jgi:RING-like zinc finger
MTMAMTILFASSRRKNGGRQSTNSSTSSTRTQAVRAPLWEYLSYVSAQQHLQAYLDAETVMSHSSRRHHGAHNKFPPGASFAAISSLPTVRVLPIHERLADETHANNRAECGICCERLVDGVALTRLPCGHVFHITCGV